MARSQSKPAPTRGYDHYKGSGIRKNYHRQAPVFAPQARDAEILNSIGQEAPVPILQHYQQYQHPVTKVLMDKQQLTNHVIRAQDEILRGSSQMVYFADRLRHLAANLPVLESQGINFGKMISELGMVESKSVDMIKAWEQMIGEAVEKQREVNKREAYEAEQARLAREREVKEANRKAKELAEKLSSERM
jgi:hypothetical protein